MCELPALTFVDVGKYHDDFTPAAHTLTAQVVCCCERVAGRVVLSMSGDFELFLLGCAPF